MAAHARLKNEFTEDEKSHNLMIWLICVLHTFLQILAVLAAITEVIKTEGGTETETEYFAALVCAGFL